MFRLNHRTNSLAATPDRTKHLLRRALLFGGGLALLWLILQLAPTSLPVDDPTPFTEIADAADGVAVRSRPTAPRLFRPVISSLSFCWSAVSVWPFSSVVGPQRGEVL